MRIAEEYFNIRWPVVFGIITTLYLTIMLLSQSLVNEIVYYNSFSEQLTYDRAEELYGILRKRFWLTYPLFPLILLVKITSVGLVIYAGVLISGFQKQIPLGRVIRVATASEVVFVLAAAVKVLWFCFFAGNYTLTDISFFYPASLINLFSTEEVDSFWIFPLQTMNLFHLIYILLLIYGLKVTGGLSGANSERIVAGTYLPVLIVWIAFIMFLNVKN